MSARFEIVRTDHGWHARFRASNGRIVWTTEVYTTRRRCLDGIRVLVAPLDADVTSIGVRTFHDAVRPVPVCDVDERGAR